MPVTIDSLFGLHQMGESIQLFAKPPVALRGTELFTPEECYADTYRFDREDFELSLAPFVSGRKSPSKAVKTHDKRAEYISLAHIRVHKVLHSADLFTQRTPGEISDNAAAEVAKARQSLKQRVSLTIERLCWMALRGTITITAANFPDSETNISIARAVTALGNPPTAWSAVAAQIVSDDLQDWKREVLQASGFKPSHAMFNESVSEYLLRNTEIKDWITQTQQGVNSFETAMFGKMGGLDIWEEYEGFYLPEGGAATPFITDDEFFLLPPEQARRSICRLIQGYAEIPSQAIGSGQAGAVAGATRAPSPGYVEYAVPIQDGDPPGIKLIGVWYGVPLIKLPLAIGYESDVTP